MNYLPNLPTDSLYKYLALVGVFVILFSIVGLIKHFRTFKERVIDLKNQNKIAKIHQAKVRRLLEDMKKRESQGMKLSDSEIEAVNCLQDDTEINTQNVACELEKAESISRLNKYVSWGAFAGIIIGLACSSIGFYFWHYRIQVYQDQLIKIQVEEKRNKALHPTNCK